MSVIRDANVVQLDVDSEVNHVVGPLNPNSTYTRKPIFIGGTPGQPGAHSCCSPVFLTLHLCDHVVYSSLIQIFPSQKASPPERPTWAAWETWPSITSKWALAKPLWSVEQSALEPVQQHNTCVYTITIPYPALTKHIKNSLSVRQNHWKNYCHRSFHSVSMIVNILLFYCNL